MSGGGSEEDSADDLVPEDWPTYYTQVPVWVLLSGCTAQAYRLYAFLAEHINSRTPGRRIAWPKGTAIARVLGLKDYRKAARYWAELQELGAIRIEEVRYAGGMRRRNRYHVRFNPPPGYEGLLSLGQFYAAHPDVRSPRNNVPVPRDPDSPGHPGGAQQGTTGDGRAGTGGGAPQGTSGGALTPTADGAPRGTAQRDQLQPHPQEPRAAPPARSAADARRAPAPPRGPAAGGVAASHGATAPDSHSSPVPRTSGGERLTRARRDELRRVEAALPPELRALLPVRRPRPLRDALVRALDQRTWQQLVERAERRWYAWGFAAAADTSTGGAGLTSPVGVAITLLQDGECPDPRCEDGTTIDSGRACPRCVERREDHRREEHRREGHRHEGHRHGAGARARASEPAPEPARERGPAAEARGPVPAPSPSPCAGWDGTPCGRNSPATGGLCTRCRARGIQGA
ncbi:hypothetical protein [Streptomyces boluensis]|uniref:Uncharacterized protein n=1 Tax=Streptomyces boluensis TaxID=1775135 RepID=A0A964UTS9_9ACTN|nr:hypothetical protein [Streptomyces boluensis]NBE54043.1 hypothetical protein [Streptomyces boluensis]